MGFGGGYTLFLMVKEIMMIMMVLVMIVMMRMSYLCLIMILINNDYNGDGVFKTVMIIIIKRIVKVKKISEKI